MIYTVTTNPNIDYYMELCAPLRVGGINRSGRSESRDWVAAVFPAVEVTAL